jgi:DNA-binding CsgD family transcriptional regulator
LALKGLVDREPELERLLALLDAAAAGRGCLMLVEGPAGIGKTRLLAAGSELAVDRGLRPLVARGSELERDFPFGAVRQLLEPYLNELDAADHAAAFAGSAAHARPLLAPTDGHPTPAADADHATLHGLYWLLVALSQREPLLLCVDDIHWLDAPSLRFLGFLARRIDGMRVLLCGALRPAEDGTDRVLISDLSLAPGIETVRPAPLTTDGVSTLIAAELGAPPEPDFLDECLTTTGGNPFYLSALIREAAAQGLEPTGAAAARVRELGPEAIARLLLRRLDALGPGAPELARALAVLGDGARVSEASVLAELDPARAAAAAHALVRADIAAGHEPLAFAHPIVRTSIYADIAAPARAEHHRRAAQLLAERGADLDRVAAQLLAAGPPDGWAVERLRTAATRALQRGAPENAAAYIRRALDCEPAPELRFALLQELAAAEAALQDPAAIGHLYEARELATDVLDRAHITAALTETCLYAGQWDVAVALPREALAELGDRDVDLALRLRTMAAAAATFDPALAPTLDGQGDALEQAALAGGKAGRALAVLIAAQLGYRGERLDDVAALVERGLDGGGLLADEHAESWVFAQVIGALMAIEAVDETERVLDAMFAEARARGSIRGFIVATCCRLYVRSYRGDLAPAAAELQHALALAHEYGAVFALPATLRWGFDAILERPDLDPAADLALTVELPPALAATVSGAWIHEMRAELALRAGDRAVAGEELAIARSVFDALGFQNPSLYSWRSAAALITGDAALAEAELADARRNGLPRGLGVALRRTALVTGDIALLEEAVAVLDGSAARLEHARALVELGAAQRRANDRLAAREPLRAGLDLAQRCGAIRLAERAAEELRAAGARPRRAAISGRDALTASERRIADMAASGLSNPEIAQALFVTIKTVEGHLSGAYRKLDVRSRAELPQALAG